MQIYLWLLPIFSLICLNIKSLHEFHNQVLVFDDVHIKFMRAKKELLNCAQQMANRANVRASVEWLRLHLKGEFSEELRALASKIPEEESTPCTSLWAPHLLGGIHKETKGFHDTSWPNWAVEIRHD